MCYKQERQEYISEYNYRTITMNFIKKCLVLSGIILPVSLSAQTVSGKLIDENSQPLPYAVHGNARYLYRSIPVLFHPIEKILSFEY